MVRSGYIGIPSTRGPLKVLPPGKRGEGGTKLAPLGKIRGAGDARGPRLGGARRAAEAGSADGSLGFWAFNMMLQLALAERLWVGGRERRRREIIRTGSEWVATYIAHISAESTASIIKAPRNGSGRKGTEGGDLDQDISKIGTVSSRANTVPEGSRRHESMIRS